MLGRREKGGEPMDKQVIRSPAVPETGGPFNLCVRHGDMLYVSGLPPFEADYCAALRAARARGEPPPPFPDLPFEHQVRVEVHEQAILEGAGLGLVGVDGEVSLAGVFFASLLVNFELGEEGPLETSGKPGPAATTER
jgi:hypothetical protein